MNEYGWCDTRDSHHGGYDHIRGESCVNFISDKDHTAKLMAEAVESDRRTTHHWPGDATTREAAYVAEHRPY